jgi:predicted RNA-binding Zn ribbon-like protein
MPVILTCSLHPALLLMSETEPSADSVFDLDGGLACLDFANTAPSAGERLTTYLDLLAFARQSQLITPQTARRLQREAARAPASAAAVLERGRRLRDALRAIFTAVAERTPPSPADVDILNANLAAALPHVRLVADAAGGSFAWSWSPDTDLATPLWPIVRSAADLLTSDVQRPLVRECGADDCGWLFLDTSRNRSRQWCSMASCGNREKARRHYQRLKAQRPRRAADPPAAQDGGAPPSERRAPRSAAAPAGGASATAE